MKKIWIIIAIIIILLGIGIYFLFSWNAGSNNSNSYQAPMISGNSGTALGNPVSYSGLDLTPTQPQTDVVPSSSTDISAP